MDMNTDTRRSQSTAFPPDSTSSKLTQPRHSSPVSPSPSTLVSARGTYTSNRQQRLLRSRHARFPARKVSFSSLSSKLTQLANSGEGDDRTRYPNEDTENVIHKSKNTRELSTTDQSSHPLDVLNEITNSSSRRSLPASYEINIRRDDPERPLLDSSPVSSPLVESDLLSEAASPLSFDHSRHSLTQMRLRQFSPNGRRSPLENGARIAPRRRLIPFRQKFDADEYIEHLEKELQHVKDEAHSPQTQHPFREKWRMATSENERLRKELAHFKERFEADVQAAVEHKTAMEVEFRRKIRDLEEKLVEQDLVMEDMRRNHEERRLADNTVDVLKTTIEKLEQEKRDMEEMNRSMSKRNEVLSELLALSPTKIQSIPILNSPTRERRNERPMSLFLPRGPVSPGTRAPAFGQRDSQMPLSALEPDGYFEQGRFLSAADLCSTFSNADRELASQSAGSPGSVRAPGNSSPSLSAADDPVFQSKQFRAPSETAKSVIVGPPSPGLSKPAPRRKPRKFMSGSTQLKPLLLPAITGENPPSASWAPSSPPLSISSRSSLKHRGLSRRSTLSDYGITGLLDDETSSVAVEKSDNVVPVVSQVERSPQWVEQVSDGPNYSPTPASLSLEAPFDPEETILQGDFDTLQAGLGFTEPCKFDPIQDMLDIETNDGRKLGQVNLEPTRYPSLHLYSENPADVPPPLFSPVGHQDDQHQAVWEQELDRRAVQRAPTQRDLSPPKHRALMASKFETPDSPTPHPTVRKDSTSSTGCQLTTMFPPLAGPKSGLSTASRNSPPQYTPGDVSSDLWRSKDSLALVRHGLVDARPLASSVIRTMYGTISKLTACVHDFRHDPLVLIRRVMANLWYKSWSRAGRLSWWILGLFIGIRPTHRPQSTTGWEAYDGESIARRFTDSDDEGYELDVRRRAARHLVGEREGRCDQELNSQLITDGVPCSETENRPGWRHSLFLWGKFSIAVMLAVGGAIVKGPGEMLQEPRRLSGKRRSGAFQTDERRLDRVDENLSAYGCRLNGSGIDTFHSAGQTYGFSRFRNDDGNAITDLSSSSNWMREDCDDTIRPRPGKRASLSHLTQRTTSYGHPTYVGHRDSSRSSARVDLVYHERRNPSRPQSLGDQSRNLGSHRPCQHFPDTHSFGFEIGRHDTDPLDLAAARLDTYAV